MQDYSAHVFIFDNDFENVAMVLDAGHSGKEPGLTPPGGRPKKKDENDPERTATREVRAETGLKFQILERFEPRLVVRGEKIILQHVYAAVALNNGSPDCVIPGETHGWKWYKFNPTDVPFDFYGTKKMELYRTYRRIWGGEILLKLVEERRYFSWWKATHL